MHRNTGQSYVSRALQINSSPARVDGTEHKARPRLRRGLGDLL